MKESIFEYFRSSFLGIIFFEMSTISGFKIKVISKIMKTIKEINPPLLNPTKENPDKKSKAISKGICQKK